LNFDQEVDVWEDIKKGKEGPGGGKLHFKLVLRADISLAPKVPDVDLVDLNKKPHDIEVDLDLDVDKKKKKPDLDIDIDFDKKKKSDLDIDIDLDVDKKKDIDIDIDVDKKKKKPDIDIDIDGKDKKIGVEVTVIEAKDLPGMDKGGSSDPFVRILYGPEITVKTGHVNKTLNPKWHKHFALKGKFPKIIFEVFDHDTIGRDSMIGYVAYTSGSLNFDQEVDVWEDIKKGKEGPGGGKLHFKLVLRADISLAPKVPDVDLVDLNRVTIDPDLDIEKKKKKPDIDLDIDIDKKKKNLILT